jgi:3-oxoacyl-[acyl-carrier-protein] synthase II
MSSTARRTVLTGIGMLTPLGHHTAATWEGIVAGRSGIRPIKGLDASRLPVRFGGEILDFDAKAFIDKKDRKQIKVMARGIQLAVAAAQVAMDDAKVDRTALDPTRFGIEFGSGLLSTDLKDLAEAAKVSCYSPHWQVDHEIWGSEGLGLIEPLWMLKYLPNFLASHISILHNAQGPNNSITQSGLSSLLALGEAHRILRRGQADFMLVGGAESKFNLLGWTRNCQFGLMSQRNDSPAKASRPFDKERDGVVYGEGAGVVIAEDLDHAKKRGARIYGEVVGFASAFDGRRDGRGLARSIRGALTQAGMTPDAIDHVNANGNSTLPGDRREAHALREVFGTRPVPVFAAKSYFGDLGAGSSAAELGLGLLAQQTGTLPSTLNYEHPDPACPVAVNRLPHTIKKPCFLKLGFNDMGQCAAVVVRRWEGQ